MASGASTDRDEEGELEGDDEGDLNVEGIQAELSLLKNDRSLTEFHRWFKKGKLVVDPEWQRQYVWDRRRASRLIESLIIDLPIPVIYLAINDQGSYEVIDGLQRLTSVFDFFDNKYALAGLEIRSRWNGSFFKDLPTELQSKLEDTTLRTFELAKTTPKELMFIIFERLNTGGMALNDMEIRNCLYRGRLNDLIKELCGDEDFRAAVNQRGLHKRMKDRMLVLRFLAFYQMTYTKARKGLKAFFNEFFSTYRNPSDEKLREFRAAFRKAARGARTVFGDKAFRLRHDGAKGEWTTSANASVFQAVAVPFTDYDGGALTRAADSIFESYLDLIASDKRWADSVRSATGDFTRIEYVFQTWNARLKSIMDGHPANDSQRCFSRALKEELFSQNATCELCGQRIVLINDAALDHAVEYWRGGTTVPENARLVHRLCNLKRRDG
jgi:hypothetical protein